ncbi:uncharacterized protein AMSG_07394, partial [Thecamonas trahens ATCC 50062]
LVHAPLTVDVHDADATAILHHTSSSVHGRDLLTTASRDLRVAAAAAARADERQRRIEFKESQARARESQRVAAATEAERRRAEVAAQKAAHARALEAARTAVLAEREAKAGSPRERAARDALLRAMKNDEQAAVRAHVRALRRTRSHMHDAARRRKVWSADEARRHARMSSSLKRRLAQHDALLLDLAPLEPRPVTASADARRPGSHLVRMPTPPSPVIDSSVRRGTVSALAGMAGIAPSVVSQLAEDLIRERGGGALPRATMSPHPDSPAAHITVRVPSIPTASP